MKDFDAIVVGAGMGGLGTSAFLSMAGMKVAVFEKHDKPGVRSMTRNPDMIRFGLKNGHSVIQRKLGGGELGAAGALLLAGIGLTTGRLAEKT